MRKLIFAAVGGSGVLLSFAILWLGIDMFGLDHWVAYLAQAVIVIEYNFLLSRFLTWRDRRDTVSFWSSWVKFHGARMLLTIPLNQALFSLLTVVFGWHYVLANVTCITAATVINYVVSDTFVFKARGAALQTPRQRNQKNAYWS